MLRKKITVAFFCFLIPSAGLAQTQECPIQYTPTFTTYEVELQGPKEERLNTIQNLVYKIEERFGPQETHNSVVVPFHIQELKKDSFLDQQIQSNDKYTFKFFINHEFDDYIQGNLIQMIDRDIFEYGARAIIVDAIEPDIESN